MNTWYQQIARAAVERIIKAELHAVEAMSADNFLQRMGDMYAGRSPMSRDCRSTVVRALKADVSRRHWQIKIVGFEGSRDVMHVFLTDNHGRVSADSFSGKLLANGVYRVVTDAGTEDLQVVRTVDVSHFLSTFC